MAWQDAFPEPIPLQNGGQLTSLRDGGNYLRLVCATHPDADLVALAAELLIRAAKSGYTSDIQMAFEAVHRVIARAGP